MLRCSVCLACKVFPCIHCQTSRMDDIFGEIDFVQNMQETLWWIPTHVDNSIPFIFHQSGFVRHDFTPCRMGLNCSSFWLHIEVRPLLAYLQMCTLTVRWFWSTYILWFSILSFGLGTLFNIFLWKYTFLGFLPQHSVYKHYIYLCVSMCVCARMCVSVCV